MKNEKYNQIIDDTYKNYQIEDVRILPNMSKEKMTEMGYRLSKEEFINKIKTDDEFSKMWGLKIEEHELSLEERNNYYTSNYLGWDCKTHEKLNKLNMPTKLITASYNNETFESYE